MSAETDITAIREALEETAAHLYSQQDGARCRGMAKDALARLDRLSWLAEYGQREFLKNNLPKCAALLSQLNTP